MILLRSGIDAADRRLLDLDLAGASLEAHVEANCRAMGFVDLSLTCAAECDLATLLQVSGEPSAAVWVIDADVWLSKRAFQRLFAALSSRDSALRITLNDGADTIAVCIPAAIAGQASRSMSAAELCQGAGQLVAELPRHDVVDGGGLDASAPATRVKSFLDVANVERYVLYARATDAMAQGVRIRDPNTIAIRGELQCGAGVEIDRDVIVEGTVLLGDGVRIGAHSIVSDSTIGSATVIKPFSIVEGAVIGANSFVGPFGRVRHGAVIGDTVQIGNFVEIKSSRIGDGSRINHLAFVGDATLGTGVTVGAATVTCNHTGSGVAPTTIGDGAYIGSGTMLVAPVSVGANATIGAGSAITKDAPAGKLTIARSRQMTIDHWQPAGSTPKAK